MYYMKLLTSFVETVVTLYFAVYNMPLERHEDACHFQILQVLNFIQGVLLEVVVMTKNELVLLVFLLTVIIILLLLKY